MDFCFFVTDLHGKRSRYDKLFGEIKKCKPQIVFLGGDLLPHFGMIRDGEEDFINEFLIKKLLELKSELRDEYPNIYVIMGNDDPRIEEQTIIEAENKGVWHYIHYRKIKYGEFNIFGYSYIPPTPFLLKDWEKYDVSVFVDPGCVHPTEGYRSVDPHEDITFTNIKKDLIELTEDCDIGNSVFLFHSPPYNTYLDRADLDDKMIDHVPIDIHVGSIAIKRFIEDNQPYLTLHGHVHESASITGYWQQKLGKTFAFSAAYEGDELSIVKFYLQDISSAERFII